MRRIAKNSTLFERAPNLVKEWHPSANAMLTPRQVTLGYSKKVWWICSESHEWRATIKSRIKGNGCPRCARSRPIDSPRQSQGASTPENPPKKIKTGTAALAAILEPVSIDEKLGHDFRKSRRYKARATAVLESPVTGHWVYADVKNYSAGGMCFETDVFIDPGTKVTIKLDRQLAVSDRRRYDSIIRWCKVLDTEDKSFSTHGIGAKFL
jgi:hypothetical protein